MVRSLPERSIAAVLLASTTRGRYFAASHPPDRWVAYLSRRGVSVIFEAVHGHRFGHGCPLNQRDRLWSNVASFPEVRLDERGIG